MDRLRYFETSNKSKRIGHKVRQNAQNKTMYFDKYENGDCFVIVFRGEGSNADYEKVTLITIEQFDLA